MPMVVLGPLSAPCVPAFASAWMLLWGMLPLQLHQELFLLLPQRASMVLTT